MTQELKNKFFTDIVLVDIINFSKLTNAQQHEIISYISVSYKKMLEMMLQNSSLTLSRFILGFVSTGDGFFSILNPRFRGYGAILGLNFNHFSEQIAKKFPYFEGVRIAVHTGDVHRFKDILEHENFIGNGLNDCSRYLEFKNYTISTVMVSQSAFESLKSFLQRHKNFNEILAKMEFKHSEKYTFYDKHNQERKGSLVWLRKSGIINPPNNYFNSLANL